MKCPYAHGKCGQTGRVAFQNPFGDKAKVIWVCHDHAPRYAAAGWKQVQGG